LKNALTAVAILLIVLGNPGKAEVRPALQLEIKFTEQTIGGSEKPAVVICDTLALPQGLKTPAFCGNLSLDLQFLGLRDNEAEFEIEQIALPPYIKTLSNRIRSPLGIPYLVDSALSKGHQVYKVSYTPLQIDTIEYDCTYDHTDSEQFYFDPSGDFDIYFVPNSLGDFHWNNIRDHLELELDRFLQFFSFGQPGKISFYLYPCPSPKYARYDHENYGIHPARNSIYTEYSHLTTGIPVEAVNLLKLWRYWGYAPQMLAEGAANLPEFHQFYCRDYAQTESLYPLGKLLVSADYDRLENRHKKKMQAASFAAYLIGTMNPGKFRELYTRATDLTLRAELEQITGKKLPQLEKDWLKYVDTISYNPLLHHFFAQRELTRRNVSEAIYLYEKGLEKKPNDTTMLTQLYNAYFLKGDYKRSAETIRKLEPKLPNSRYLVPYANMLLSQGEFDSARYYYNLAEKSDTTAQVVLIKLGQIDLATGRLEDALGRFHKLLDSSGTSPYRIDACLNLGLIAKNSGQADSAREYFTMALNGAKNLLASGGDNPIYNLRAGEAALYLKESQAASEYLSMAEFVELRPFYLGRIFLTIGKMHDLKKERAVARQYYQRVLDINAAYLDKSEAQKYLSQPFTF